MGVNYRSTYNFKCRRFIVSGKDCFTQMWRVADIVYNLLCDNGLIDHRRDRKKYRISKYYIEYETKTAKTFYKFLSDVDVGYII